MRAPSFWYRRDAGAEALGLLLSPLGALYGCAARLKRAGAKPYSARAQVVCVGNLTLGGTGKTPSAIALAERFRRKDFKTVFLTRGYGGRLPGPLEVDADRHDSGEVGDEALLLARHAPTILSRDRAKGARMADALGAQIIVMDDGHQNPSLKKDISLVVVDGEAGFGNGRVFPAGPLREKLGDGLARADAVIVMGSGAPNLGAFMGPVLHARLLPEKAEDLRGAAVLAFAGIGRPEKFFASLTELGANLVAAHGFADHHRYTVAELNRLKHEARGKAARLVTTEKDLVRIAPAMREGIEALNVRTEFSDEAALSRVLDRLAPNETKPAS